MRALDASLFRLLLVLATVLFTALPALVEDVGFGGELRSLMLMCPGAFFAPVLLLSTRPHPFISWRSASGALLFLALIGASSFLAVVTAMQSPRDLEWLYWPLAGSLGALLTLVSMRVCLRYRINGLWGWFVPSLAALLSQVASLGLVDSGVSQSISLYLNPFTLLWWWFVGEALLFQQTHLPLLSNKPLHLTLRASALSAGERRR